MTIRNQQAELLTRTQWEGQLAWLPQQVLRSSRGEAAAPIAMLRTTATTAWRRLMMDMVDKLF